MPSYRVEALWDCPFCGIKGNKGRYMHCPHCGSPRGEDIRFYPPQDLSINNAVDESRHHITNAPDWLCAYCGAYNSSDALFCPNCGAEKTVSEKNYADFNPTERD